MKSSGLVRALGFLLLATATSSASAAEDAIPAIELPLLNPLESAKRSDMRAFAARPLFDATRRPDNTEATPVVVDIDKEATAAPEFVLLGVTSGPDGSIARIAASGGTESRSLRRGEAIDGWTLQAIDGASVTIAQAGKIIVLTIFSNWSNQRADESGTISSDEGVVFSPAEPDDPAPTVRVIDGN
jgi:hypothetical protein